MSCAISVIIPALDEASGLARTLEAAAPLRTRGHEIIVVDGGSADGTRAIAVPFADRVLVAPRGRAHQMNAGARVARGDALLFLHADTVLPPLADRAVIAAFARGAQWGRFDVRIDSRSALLAAVGACMNVRSRVTGIATGDQAIFVRREVFMRAGGFPEIALMEDIAFSGRMRRRARPACLRECVLTSDRRWRRHGALATILLMWRLRLAFFLGADPEALARRYAK
jgi:rSAM/selenodomain-associated transferase 2